MKRISLLLLAFLIISTSISAKEKSAKGSWLLTKIVDKGEVHEPYVQVTFKDDGYATWSGRVFGKWEQDKKAFTIESKMIEEFSAKWEISKFKNGELILTKPDTKLVFVRFDKAKMEEENKNSGLEGMWKVNETILKASEENIEEAVEEAVEEPNKEEYTDEEWEEEYYKSEKTIIFTLPDEIKILTKFNGGTESESGTWMYNNTEKSLILVIRSKDEPVYKIDIKIVRLGFTEEDFFDENGDYLYQNEEEKLPRMDFYEILESLEKVEKLVYNCSIKLRGTELFDTKEVVAKVNATFDEEIIDINNIFENDDRYSHSEYQDYSENRFDDNNLLYPLGDQYYSFRVAGQEEITTPAGTFDCTVVEACGHFNKIYRIWMINDNPLIFAKFIEEEPGTFDENFIYKVFVLIEINQSVN